MLRVSAGSQGSLARASARCRAAAPASCRSVTTSSTAGRRRRSSASAKVPPSTIASSCSATCRWDALPDRPIRDSRRLGKPHHRLSLLDLAGVQIYSHDTVEWAVSGGTPRTRMGRRRSATTAHRSAVVIAKGFASEPRPYSAPIAWCWMTSRRQHRVWYALPGHRPGLEHSVMSCGAAHRAVDEALGTRLAVSGNFAAHSTRSQHSRQQQNNEAFSPMGELRRERREERLDRFQRWWYLKLYGFGSRRPAVLSGALVVVFDAAVAWLQGGMVRRLAPHALVIGMDFSDAARQAARACAGSSQPGTSSRVASRRPLPGDADDYASCDQVIMDGESGDDLRGAGADRQPRQWRTRVCFYAKKALPRELLTTLFAVRAPAGSRQLWDMAEQLTELGKRFSALNVEFDVRVIPGLGIEGGVTTSSALFTGSSSSASGTRISVARPRSSPTSTGTARVTRAVSATEVGASAQANGLAETLSIERRRVTPGRFRRCPAAGWGSRPARSSGMKDCGTLDA